MIEDMKSAFFIFLFGMFVLLIAAFPVGAQESLSAPGDFLGVPQEEEAPPPDAAPDPDPAPDPSRAVKETVVLDGGESRLDRMDKLTAETMAQLKRLPPGIQEELMAESDQTFRYCESNVTLANFYDCSCFTLRMLDDRIRLGPDKPMINMIKDNRFKDCASEPLAVGYGYSRCRSLLLMDKISTQAMEDICTCAGKTLGDRFVSLPIPDIDYIHNIYGEAISECRRAQRR